MSPTDTVLARGNDAATAGVADGISHVVDAMTTRVHPPVERMHSAADLTDPPTTGAD